MTVCFYLNYFHVSNSLFFKKKNENEVTVTTQHLLCTALTNLILKTVASKSKKEKMCVSFWLYVL